MLATCQLNQWAMSFGHNKRNTIESIKRAKEMGAAYLLGPELQLSGYSCEDHFYENDTIKHTIQSIAEILDDKELTKDILVDIGAPLYHKQTLYNCRVFMLNQEVILIRPKMFLAGGNNYNESRYFAPWQKEGLEPFRLHGDIVAVKGQREAPIGQGVIQCRDTTIASEICEEVWMPRNRHVEFGLDGVEIISNGSGSHHELRKLN